ncbi:CRISPR-associated endonuclease Cas3'' [Phycicoccus sp. CSK15P-2]|uniref:CRISPR-associated endonuclease Cas3'' n=1 Tax=Phycicoccus sp. CSK15P-2 TaxID=2807627 RepID=UPI00194F8EED|nr:CRISPR-associated endonuclease Cas3'' [Phycicoccus sp. CSK15P-2]MBM6404836.1 CRISPR-associated endonuclease Cas3'' [Phycicoccus sp. CSK15P-2]
MDTTNDGQPVSRERLSALWAKSDAGGRPHSLIGHLLDTAAVAELVHDEFLSAGAQRSLDAGVPGRGRDLLRLLSGWHDVGKACPAFQFMRLPGGSTELKEAVLAAGFGEVPLHKPWRHTIAGARALGDFLGERGAAGASWVLPVIEGHHGRFGSPRTRLNPGQGRTPEWGQARVALFDRVLAELGLDVQVLDGPAPSHGVQLALAGLVSMADWVASSSEFPGVGPADLDIHAARSRAVGGWRRIGLTGGWAPERLRSDPEVFRARIGREPRPLQELVSTVAADMPAPGLLVVEAPMGEGKTEAAFAAAEILGDRFGAGGFVFAMPTQGTTDAMYDRVRTWVRTVDPDMVVSLRHGRAMANESFRASLAQERLADVGCDVPDAYGVSDWDYGGSDTAGPPSVVHETAGPAQWLLGRHRALLAPGVVGTVDQILYAGTRTKYVSLRHAGLLGKVVIVDEVHAYDVYMQAFLETLLRWCSDAGVPVVLMSATLPPALRGRLVSAYVRGWSGGAVAGDGDLPEPSGYPSVLAAVPGVDDRAPTLSVASTTPWRADLEVDVEALGSASADAAPIVERVAAEVSEGGCVLVIVNTVRRAQDVFEGLDALGVETVLVHGRLTTGERAARVADLVDRLGASRSPGAGRPYRLVVVATQIAEQSFDVDADLLVTDIAPMDLLLQRVGRLHRHDRPSSDRPAAMAAPRVIVTGFAPGADAAPDLCPSFGRVYERSALLRAAALLGDGARWSIPSEVPGLVASAYGMAESLPVPWVEAISASDDESAESDEARSAFAGTFTLSPTASGDLTNLHLHEVRESGEEATVVRDGEPTREVALVVRTHDGRLRTLGSGRTLGMHGESAVDDGDLAREVLGDTVRFRHNEAIAGVQQLSGWRDVPLLSRLEVVVLDESLVGEDDARLRYDRRLGLVITKVGR